MIHLIQHPSYSKITPETIRPDIPYTSDYVSQGEELGYQVVVYTDNAQGIPAKFELSFDGEYQVYLEKYINVDRPHFENDTKRSYLTDKPDVLPDCLIPITPDDVFFINCNYIVLWVSISTENIGEAKSVLKISTKNESASCELNLNVVQINKKPQFFGHCEYIDPIFIAKDHGVAMFGDMFWKILHQYFKLAADHGVNEILVPLFTPQYPNYPSDKFVQLVSIKKMGDDYECNFDLFDRWIKTAVDAGISRFTFPVFLPDFDHPFGAQFIVQINGEEQIIYENETVLSKSYAFFIRRFLRRLMMHLEKYRSYIFSFHFSCSPQVWNEKTYQNFRAHFYDYVKKYRITDYDVEFRFFKRGLVGSPMVHLHDIYAYAEDPSAILNGCFDISNPKDPINPSIASSSVRLRYLGAFGYRYELARFFHLGFNAHDLNDQYPTGSLSLVYPGESEAYPSIRLKQLKYAIQDHRLLDTLHSRYSPKRMNGLIDRYLSKNDCYTNDPIRYQKFRIEIYELLENVNKYRKRKEKI